MTGIRGKIAERNMTGSDNAEHLGRRLRVARELAGLTQVELATRMGIAQSALSRIEREADMRVSTLRSYIEGLGAALRISAQLNSARPCKMGPKSLDGSSEFTLPIFDDGYFKSRRDVVVSVKPQYSRKIESGEKTVELRRRFPEVPKGTVTLIYSTSPTRALTGIAEIEDVVVSSPAAIWRRYASEACIQKMDFDRYFDGLAQAYAIKLRRARPLRRIFDLTELRERFNFEPPQSFLYAKPQLREALGYEWAEISNRH